MKPFELPEEPHPGVTLYCEKCRNTFSACRADYTSDPWRPQNVDLKCAYCDVKLDLVVERRAYEKIDLLTAERKIPRPTDEG